MLRPAGRSTVPAQAARVQRIRLRTMRVLVLGGTSFVGRTIVTVPPDSVPPPFPLVRPEPMWPGQQRSPARGRAAGMLATPLAVTAAAVLAWDRARGEPPLTRGLPAADEEKLLAGAIPGAWDGAG